MASSDTASPGAGPAAADPPGAAFAGAGPTGAAFAGRGPAGAVPGGAVPAGAGSRDTAGERLAGADFDRLRSFQALSEELHFTRAAARLHLTQPALSQHIRALERQLGTVLVLRHARGCTLTPIGERVAEEATRLLADADAAAARIRAAVRGREGRLRLAYTRSARGGRVDALVARFRREHPQVEVVPETGWTAPNVAGLLAGRFDAAFVRPPLDEPALTCHHVDSEELLLAMPENHPLAERRRIARPDIAGLPAVMWPRENGPGMFDRTIAQVWPAGGFHLVRHEPDDEQLLRAVAEGTVIAAVPAGRARALKVPGVRLRRFTEPVPTVEIALAYPADTTNPAVHHLAALLDTPFANPL